MVTETSLTERFVGSAGFHKDISREALCADVEMMQKHLWFLSELDSEVNNALYNLHFKAKL